MRTYYPSDWKPCPLCGCDKLFINVTSLAGVSGTSTSVGCTKCHVVVKSNEELPENHIWNQRAK